MGEFSLWHLIIILVIVLIFFGPVAVAGTYYIQALSFSWPACWAGIATGLLSCAILAVNNLRDIDQDRKAHKKTLAVRFGRQFANVEYVFCLLVPALIAFWMHAWAASLVPILGLVLMRKSSLNKLLAQTALLGLVFAMVFATQKSLQSNPSPQAHTNTVQSR